MRRLSLIALAALFSFPVFGQDEPTGAPILEKRSGELVTFTWEYDDDVAVDVSGWVVCRQVGIYGSTTCVTVAADKREFKWPMPGGSTPEYRLRVYAQNAEGIGFAGPELIVLRKR
jgi:hypothetical protein